MKKLLFIPLSILYMVMCGFGPTNTDCRVTNAEMDANSELLKSAGVLPELFYGCDFLYPKMRFVSFGSDTVVDQKQIALGLKNMTRSDSLRRDSLSRVFEGEEKFLEISEREKKYNAVMRELRQKLMTPERSRVVEQLRKLASDYTVVEAGEGLAVTISREVAIEQGISEVAYDNYMKWMNHVNTISLKHNIRDDNSLIKYCQVYFDDNVFDRENDVIISRKSK